MSHECYLFSKIIKTAQSCYGKTAFKMATFQFLAYFLIKKIRARAEGKNYLALRGWCSVCQTVSSEFFTLLPITKC